MATNEVDDIFNCSVCMEPMLDKQPRLLVCAHTFCLLCLQQLAAQNRNQIACSKCRTVTDLPSGDVEKLPKHMELSGIKDLITRLSDKISENFKADNLCKLCFKRGEEKRATHICIGCSNKFICKNCADNQSKRKALKSHQVIMVEQTHVVSTEGMVCDKHKEKVEYFCRNCKESLCVYCALSESHNDHGSDILDFKPAFEEYKRKCDDVRSEIKTMKSKIKLFKSISHSDLDMLSASKNQLEERRELLKGTLKLFDESIQNVKKSKEKLQTLCESFDDFHPKCEDIYTKWSSILQKSELEYIKGTKLMDPDIREMFDKGSNLLETEHEFESFVANSYFSNEVVGSFKKAKFVHLEKPELVSEMKASAEFQIESPWDLIAANEDSVFVVDRHFDFLQRVTISGKVAQTLFTSNGCREKCATILDKQVYLVTCGNDVIQQHAIVHENAFQKVANYQVNGISKAQDLSAAGSHLIIIQETCISEYNLITRENNIKIDNLPQPWYTYLTNFHGETKYLVTDQKARKVFIYNGQWILQSTIGTKYNDEDTLIGPCHLAVTPGGKILVAEYGPKQISMFNMNEKFICVLLELEKNPEAVAYTSSHLWVAHKEPEPCLRLYKVGDL